MAQSSAYFDLVKINNLTTEINILRATKDVRYEALEFDRERITIECAERTCNTGQLVKIEGFICTPTQRKDFTAVAKVKSVEFIDESNLRVTLQFLQYNRELWEQFVDYLNVRQTKVDQLFSLMRDEA